MFQARQTPAHTLMRQDFESRITGFADRTECVLEDAQQKMQRWKEAGSFTVFNAGAFDILGLNHILGLTQCRLLGAMSMLGIEKLEEERDVQRVHLVAASTQIRLMVTVDTDQALEEGKSRRAEKGNAPKPTLSWNTRAAMLAAQSILQSDHTQRINLVDYITRHGPQCCAVCSSGTCTNEDNARMAVALQPDLVVVNSGSLRTVADLTEYKKDGRLPDTELVAINEDSGAFTDPILGGTISTTAIINRIRS